MLICHNNPFLLAPAISLDSELASFEIHTKTFVTHKVQYRTGPFGVYIEVNIVYLLIIYKP